MTTNKLILPVFLFVSFTEGKPASSPAVVSTFKVIIFLHFNCTAYFYYYLRLAWPYAASAHLPSRKTV